MSPLPNPWLGDVAGGPSWLLRGFTGEITVSEEWESHRGNEVIGAG